MCCFAQTVSHVGSTKIFARLTGAQKQVLAYSMQYETDVPNAMILPLPTTGREDSLRFIDLSSYDYIFNDLQRGFPKKKGLFSNVLPSSRALDSKAATLKVHKIGNFVASFAPSADDLARLDAQFVIPKETWEKIPNYAGYGFAVFQLDEAAGKTHPMAMEFETSLKEKVFFPTLHIHDGQVHKLEDFDHYLFMQHAGFDSIVDAYDGPRHEDPKTGMVRSKELAGNFTTPEKSQGLIDSNLLLHRKRMHGKLPNQDKIVRAAGHPTKVSFNWNPLIRLWPVAAAGTGLAWIIGRRSLLSKKPSATRTKND